MLGSFSHTLVICEFRANVIGRHIDIGASRTANGNMIYQTTDSSRRAMCSAQSVKWIIRRVDARWRYLKYLPPWISVHLMLALTALRTQGLYRLISSTFGRYLLYEIVKCPARVLLIGCFKPPRLSRSRYLRADCYLVNRLYILAYSDIIVFSSRDGSCATLHPPKSIKRHCFKSRLLKNSTSDER